MAPGFGEKAGKAIGLHPDIDCVGFTGSTEVGKLFMQYSGQSNLKRVWLECGGKTPVIVLGDCHDSDAAARSAAFGIFFNQGEVCNAGSRLLLHKSIKEPFLEKLQGWAKKLQPGDPLIPKCRMGAIVDKNQMNRVLGYIEKGQQQGAKSSRAASRCARIRRLLCGADHLRRRQKRHGHRSGRDLRAGAVCTHLR